MKSISWLTITIAVVFVLAIETSQSVFAQANDIKGGSLEKRRTPERSKPER